MSNREANSPYNFPAERLNYDGCLALLKRIGEKIPATCDGPAMAAYTYAERRAIAAVFGFESRDERRDVA